jgi:CheY-like chemotaxis protein
VGASSEGLGRGSEFTLTLPVSHGRRRGTEAASPEQGPGSQSRRVLVVEDDPDSAQSMAMLLDLWGHRAETALDGYEALLAARRFRPEIVFVDIGIPGLDGYEVAERLRSEHGPDLKLVALTGFGREEDRLRARDAGFDCHLTKPLEPPVLRDILSSLDVRSVETDGSEDRGTALSP